MNVYVFGEGRGGVHLCIYTLYVWEHIVSLNYRNNLIIYVYELWYE